MKIDEVKLEETLPPHLAKFFDKDGNYNKAAQARIDAGRKNPGKGKWKDATPKGYGPDEVDEVNEVPERTSLMSAMREEHKKTQEGFMSSSGKYHSSGNPNFLIREKGMLRNQLRWSIMIYEDKHGSNPQGLRTKLNQHAENIGFKEYIVIGQWVGDLDKVLEDAKSKLASGQEWINSVKHDLEVKVKSLTNAKKVMAAGEEVDMTETISNKAHSDKHGQRPSGTWLQRGRKIDQSETKVRAKHTKNKRDVANEDAQDVANDKIKRIEKGINNFIVSTWQELDWPIGFERDMAIVIAAELEADGGEVIGGMEEDKRDIKSVKKTKTGTKYQMKSGTMVYDMKEGMPPANQVVIIAHKGKKIGSFEVRHGAKVHHIDQELRKLSKDITLGNFERTSVARDLAHGKIARSGDFAFQIQDARPKELE